MQVRFVYHKVHRFFKTWWEFWEFFKNGLNILLKDLFRLVHNFKKDKVQDLNM